MSTIWIAVGSNLGDRPAFLARAIEALAAGGVDVLRVSHAYETRPEAGADEPPYLNAVLEAATSLAPEDLLRRLHEVERALGRSDERRSGPRTCDLDLLAYEDQVLDEPGLIVPHPRMHRRGFVLVPLCELDVHWRHPVLGLEAGELLAGLHQNEGEVRLSGPLPLPPSLERREAAGAKS